VLLIAGATGDAGHFEQAADVLALEHGHELADSWRPCTAPGVSARVRGCVAAALEP
jgi:hypothetical protein